MPCHERYRAAGRTGRERLPAPVALRRSFRFGRVEGDGIADEGLQRLLVYLLALVEVDGPPGVPVEAGVEQARRIRQSRSLGEGHLHDLLVGLSGTDDSAVRPHRNPSPLP